MAASDFDFVLTRNQLITRAFQKIGALDVYDVLSSEMLSQGLDALNLMVAEWQNDHVFLWREQELTIDPWAASAATEVYPGSGDPLILALSSAQWWNGIDWEPLELIRWGDYLAITDRDTEGVPEKITHNHYDGKPYLYPEPKIAGKVRAVVTTKLKDFDLAAGTADFTARWGQAIVYGLAGRLCDDYGLPLGERQSLKNDAQGLFTSAKRMNRDRSDELFVRPI